MIYGNDKNLNLMQSMKRNQHLPHACLFYGEKGSGRKTLAQYFAMTVLCSEENAPCGQCRNCQKILHGSHPDLIFAEHSGKKSGFSVDTVREICRDAVVAPNDSDKKIYIFTDCDNISISAQNTLLKLTEEPPEHVLLVFTAVSESAFLGTMLSRMMRIAVCPCKPEECRNALIEKDYSPENAEKAVSATGGRNIGLALAWLENPDFQEMTRQASAFTLAVAYRNQYEMLQILSGYEKDRSQAEAFLKLLLVQFRDACMLRYENSDLLGCDKSSAQVLSKTLTSSGAVRYYQGIQNACEALQANVSTKLVLASLGGQLL
jgi:DNA polymerase-3 subunit delta'